MHNEIRANKADIHCMHVTKLLTGRTTLLIWLQHQCLLMIATQSSTPIPTSTFYLHQFTFLDILPETQPHPQATTMERTTPSTHTPATTTTTKKNIFRFFDLPRELRDDIYSRLSPRHARVKGKRCGLTFVRELRFPHFPVLDLLLVSRKFEFEYEEAIARDPRSKELVVDVDLKPVTKVWGATPNSLLDRLYPIERVEVRQNRRAMIEMWEGE